MNQFLYQLLLFGWKAQTPGGQVGPTLSVPDHALIITSEGLHIKYSKDTVYKRGRGYSTFTICFPESRLRVVVLKTVLI